MASLTDPIIEARIDRIKTQFRESPNLIHVMRTYLAQLVDARNALEEVASAFDIDTATGDQLTLLGARMGFPRPHPAGRLRTFFGFPGRPAIATPVDGWWDGEWQTGPQTEEASMEDELYRRFLKTLRFKIEAQFERPRFIDAARTLLGNNAHLLAEKAGALQLATGRLLTEDERTRVHLFAEVLPVAPGVKLEVWEVESTFGFGEGWGGWGEGQWPYRIW